MKGFVRIKMIRGKPHHYLVQSYRDEWGQPRQRDLAYLGKHSTTGDRISYLNKQLRTWRRQLQNVERLMNRDGTSLYAYQQSEIERAAKEYHERADKLDRTIRRTEQSLKKLKAACSDCT